MVPALSIRLCTEADLEALKEGRCDQTLQERYSGLSPSA
jgi:hypothetical protein